MSPVTPPARPSARSDLMDDDVDQGILVPGTAGVLGVGVDIIETSRFRGLAQDSGVVSQFLTDEEIVEVFSKQAPGPTLAGRFAAKEAVIKAFRTAFPSRRIFFRDIVIVHGASGEPMARIHEDEPGNYQIILSVSHTEERAIAFAAVVRMDDADGSGPTCDIKDDIL
jgi:holo-[acyl-carrier protein] synthase